MQTENKIDFQHHMSAHCENGATSNLLRYYGVELSEPMVFGLGCGLAFVYVPFLKFNGAPITSFRPMPGSIFNRVNKTIGTNIFRKKFTGKPAKAMQALDETLEKGIPVGLLVGVYNLTYFPTALRFHFNAHNIVVYQKKDENYLVSDSVMENPEWLSAEDLAKVRYAKGTYKPEGTMYYVKSVKKEFDLHKAVAKSIKYTAMMMIKAPGPIIGVSAIKLLSKSIRKWPKKYDSRKASKYLGSVIRMQEEIGTGGAGFRFIYAAFLQEAGKKLENNFLIEASEKMTEIGDLWRTFAIDSGRVCKLRSRDNESYDSVADQLLVIAEKEKQLFTQLLKTKI